MYKLYTIYFDDFHLKSKLYTHRLYTNSSRKAPPNDGGPVIGRQDCGPFREPKKRIAHREIFLKPYQTEIRLYLPCTD